MSLTDHQDSDPPPPLPNANPLVIFDGVCNLCTASVRFIVRHESAPVLRFTPVQSPAGAALLRRYGFDPAAVKTFVVIEDGALYVQSDAAIRVARYLHAPWKYLGVVVIVPRPIRDGAYDLVARHRYSWFGRMDACMVPSPALQARFVQVLPLDVSEGAS